MAKKNVNFLKSLEENNDMAKKNVNFLKSLEKNNDENYILNKYKYKWKYVGNTENEIKNKNEKKTSRYELPGFDGYEPPLVPLPESIQYYEECKKMYDKMFSYKKSDKFKKQDFEPIVESEFKQNQNGGDIITHNHPAWYFNLIDTMRPTLNINQSAILCLTPVLDVHGNPDLNPPPNGQEYFTLLDVNTGAPNVIFSINSIVLDIPNLHLQDMPDTLLLVDSINQNGMFNIDPLVNNDYKRLAQYDDGGIHIILNRIPNLPNPNDIGLYIQTIDSVIDVAELLPTQQDVNDVYTYTTEWYRFINPSMWNDDFLTAIGPNSLTDCYQTYINFRGGYDLEYTPFYGVVQDPTINEFMQALEHFRINFNITTSNKALRIQNNSVKAYNYNNHPDFPLGLHDVQLLWRSATVRTDRLVIGSIIPNINILSTSYDFRRVIFFYQAVVDINISPVIWKIDLVQSTLCNNIPYIQTSNGIDGGVALNTNFPMQHNVWKSDSPEEREIIFPINCSLRIIRIEDISAGLMVNGVQVPPNPRGMLVTVELIYNDFLVMEACNISVKTDTQNLSIYKQINYPGYNYSDYFLKLYNSTLYKPVKDSQATVSYIRYGGTNKYKKTKKHKNKNKTKNKKQNKKTKKQKKQKKTKT